MKKGFYFRLAKSGLRQNRQIVLPYLISSICTVALFYIMYSLSVNSGFAEGMRGGRTLASMLNFGSVVTALFGAIFLFYTNSFLMKRRKKELGLYNILGMGKRQLGKLMLRETLLLAGASLVGGLVLGILVSRALFAVLLNLLHIETAFRFEIPPAALAVTAVLFGAIFLLTLLFNLAQVHLARPIELLHGGEAGEREPKTRLPLAILGVLTLGFAYYLALTLRDPLNSLPIFFIAVLLVIVGTFCLFTAGSIAILKLLRKNKKFYYNKRHFAAVSGMLYRMKQNAAGLALICVLSSAVLVTISTTLALNLGAEDSLHTNYPHALSYSVDGVDDPAALGTQALAAAEAETGLTPRTVQSYRAYNSFVVVRNGEVLNSDTLENPEPGDLFLRLSLLPAEDASFLGDEVPSDGELLLYVSSEEDLPFDALTFGERTLPVAQRHSDAAGETLAGTVVDCYGVLPSLDDCRALFSAVSAEDTLTYTTNLDFSEPDGELLPFSDALQAALRENESGYSFSSRPAAADEFYSLYGGLFFVGILLGFLFLMVTVLIIYYKQVSEGYDDRRRFQIMRKVGMSRREIKSSIHSQILMVFFLPLLAAFLHLAVAFNVIRQLLLLFSMTNTGLYVLCLVGVMLAFALIYTAVYLITARTYYKITSANN